MSNTTASPITFDDDMVIVESTPSVTTVAGGDEHSGSTTGSTVIQSNHPPDSATHSSASANPPSPSGLHQLALAYPSQFSTVHSVDEAPSHPVSYDQSSYKTVELREDLNKTKKMAHNQAERIQSLSTLLNKACERQSLDQDWKHKFLEHGSAYHMAAPEYEHRVKLTQRIRWCLDEDTYHTVCGATSANEQLETEKERFTSCFKVKPDEHDKSLAAQGENEKTAGNLSVLLEVSAQAWQDLPKHHDSKPDFDWSNPNTYQQVKNVATAEKFLSDFGSGISQMRSYGSDRMDEAYNRWDMAKRRGSPIWNRMLASCTANTGADAAPQSLE
nr:uncharacterized protein CI109_005371 [Kwoniella shandongensis]KAA5526247.1 hypothetical protein CI109_005371 [Kwoniella shandongensis]